MERRWAIACAIACLIILCGCAAPLTPPKPLWSQSIAPDRSAATLAFAVENCEYAEFGFRVAPERLRPFLPEAFDVRISSSGGGTVALGAAVCADGSFDGARGPVAFAWTDILVAPNDPSLLGDGIDVYLYRVENPVRSDAYGALMARVGSQRSIVSSIGVLFTSTYAHFHVEGDGLDYFGSGPALTILPPDPPVRFREYGAAPAGFAYVEADLTPGESIAQAVGVFDSSPGSVAASILGTRAHGLWLAGHGYGFGPRAFMGWVPFEPTTDP
ncbi:MAG TPA: hypothetical protein VI565_10245 [Burkholderiales bacterium]|nr:hypothetical protein [Burkholderiales bacterium]